MSHGAPSVAPRVAFLYALAGADVHHPPGAGRLARRLLGASSLRYGATRRGEDASLVALGGGEYCIHVRRSAEDAAINAGIATCLVRWAVHCGLFQASHPEVRGIVAGLLLPLPALLAAKAQGLTTSEIAASYLCPEPLVCLQIRKGSGLSRSGTHLRLVG